MNLKDFSAIIRERIPTPQEFLDMVRGQGWNIVAGEGRAALKVSNKSDPLAVALARMLSREPYRTRVLALVVPPTPEHSERCRQAVEKLEAEEALRKQERERKAGLCGDTAPTPPLGKRLYYFNEHGSVCGPEDAYMWTWEGGPRWFHTSEYPVPLAAKQEVAVCF